MLEYILEERAAKGLVEQSSADEPGLAQGLLDGCCVTHYPGWTVDGYVD